MVIVEKHGVKKEKVPAGIYEGTVQKTNERQGILWIKVNGDNSPLLDYPLYKLSSLRPWIGMKVEVAINSLGRIDTVLRVK